MTFFFRTYILELQKWARLSTWNCHADYFIKKASNTGTWSLPGSAHERAFFGQLDSNFEIDEISQLSNQNFSPCSNHWRPCLELILCSRVPIRQYRQDKKRIERVVSVQQFQVTLKRGDPIFPTTDFSLNFEVSNFDLSKSVTVFTKRQLDNLQNKKQYLQCIYNQAEFNVVGK